MTLSSSGGHTGRKPFEGNAPSQRRLYAAFQSQARKGRVCISGAVQGDSGGDGELSVGTGAVHRAKPLRAGMVGSAEHWLWSSYRFTAGLAPSPPWFDQDWLLGEFGSRRDVAVRKYMEFVADGVQRPSPWRMLKQQIFFGGDAFVTKAQAGIVGQNLTQVPRIQRRARPKPLDFFARKAANRHEAMFLAYRSGGYTLKEIGDYFGVHYSTVSRALKHHASGKT